MVFTLREKELAIPMMTLVEHKSWKAMRDQVLGVSSEGLFISLGMMIIKVVVRGFIHIV